MPERTILKFGVLPSVTERNDALMADFAPARRSIAPRSSNRTGVPITARRIDDFLNMTATQTTRDQHAFKRAFRAQSFQLRNEIQ